VPQASVADDHDWPIAKPRGGVSLIYGPTTDVEGEAVEDEYVGALIAEAEDFAVKPVLKVLEGPGDLTVKAGDVEATIPQEGRAAAVAEFGTLCTLD